MCPSWSEQLSRRALKMWVRIPRRDKIRQKNFGAQTGTKGQRLILILMSSFLRSCCWFCWCRCYCCCRCCWWFDAVVVINIDAVAVVAVAVVEVAAVDVVEVVVFDVDGVAFVVLKEAPITTRDFRPPMFFCIVGTIIFWAARKTPKENNAYKVNLGEIKTK